MSDDELSALADCVGILLDDLHRQREARERAAQHDAEPARGDDAQAQPDQPHDAQPDAERSA